MPIIPSVFQPIRANDFQQRPVKTYKHYKVLSSTFSNNDGYFRHNAIYRKHVPHIDGDTGQGVGDRVFPINSDDNTNQHVIWNVINHKYYRKNNPAEAADFLDINSQIRSIWHSASLFTAPYGQVGEKIKHGTFKVTSSIGGLTINLHDDGSGNLIDPIIDTTTFASSSRNFFYMSFNDLYKKFNDYDELGTLSKGITYKLNKVEKSAIINDSVTIVSGIEVTSSAVSATPSGLAAKFDSTLGHNMRIPHNDKFDRFGHYDDWTISFWHRYNGSDAHTILSKWGVKEESYLDSVDGKRKLRTVNNNPAQGASSPLMTAANFESNNIRTPMHIVANEIEPGGLTYDFIACDGKKATLVSTGEVPITSTEWQHICVRNSASKLEIFANGVTGSGGTTGTLPDFTSNIADIVIGNTNSEPSNVHGIRSTYKVWKETKILDPLLNYIQNTINELYKSKFTGDYFSISSSWSIIYKKDDYAKPHIHLPNTWAFVYYLKSSGRTPIIFNDINFSINPIDDMLLVFPATLKHSVPPHEGDEDRICVAGNMHADR